MRNALYRYAEHIKPESDVVNLLPFGQSGPLLRQWQGEPYALKLMLNSYMQETSSSDAEGALAAASRGTQKRSDANSSEQLIPVDCSSLQ